MDTQLRNAIIQELNITSLSQVEIDRIILDLGKLILQNIMIEVTDVLSDEDVILFETIINQGDLNTVSLFLEDKVKNFDEIVVSMSKKVVSEYKQGK